MSNLVHPTILVTYKHVIIYRYDFHVGTDRHEVHIVISNEFIHPRKIKMTWADKLKRVNLEAKVEREMNRIRREIDDILYHRYIARGEIEQRIQK